MRIATGLAIKVADNRRPADASYAENSPPIYVTFLNRLDVEALALTDDEILGAIEGRWRRKAAARP